MRNPGLLLALCVLLAPCAPLRAQTAEDAPGRARELLAELDAAVKPLERGAYHERDRRPVAEILARLRVQTAALLPPAGAPIPPERAEALRKLETDAAELARLEDEFWETARKAPSPEPFPAATAGVLERRAAALAADFSRLFPARPPGAAAERAPARAPESAALAVAAAAESGKAAATEPRRFYDGGAEKGGGRAGIASNGPSRRFKYAPAPPRVSDLILAPVPAPKRSPREEACRQASGEGAAARVCGWGPLAAAAPVAAGVIDAFKEQFGTVSGVVSLLAFTAFGFILSALSGGVGLVLTLLKALCGIAIVLTAASMLYRLAAALKDFATTKDDDPRHWAALRAIGKVGGELLIMGLMIFAGYKLGQRPAVKDFAASMTGTLQRHMGRVGIRPKPAAPELSAAFGEVPAAKAPALPAAPSRFEVAANKWNYFFGRVKAKITKDMTRVQIEKQIHNQDRSVQIARVLRDNGIEDTPAGRERLMALFDKALSAPAVGEAKTTAFGYSEYRPVELPKATLRVSFFHPKEAPSRVEVSSIIPLEHGVKK